MAHKWAIFFLRPKPVARIGMGGKAIGFGVAEDAVKHEIRIRSPETKEMNDEEWIGME